MTSHAVWGLAATTFVAAFVEFVEALTIVLAMALTRGWRSALAGTAAALFALAAFTAVVGYALASWLPRSALQLVVGVLLLIFGLQWLRKAILRSAGLKALHDEEVAFGEQTAAARDAGVTRRAGLDWFGFVVSFKGVFLEGVEVVFIVITFGLNAGNVPVAVSAAVAAGVVVTVIGAIASRPLTAVPENTLKYAVGLLLATYGTFWAVEGFGAPARRSEPDLARRRLGGAGHLGRLAGAVPAARRVAPTAPPGAGGAVPTGAGARGMSDPARHLPVSVRLHHRRRLEDRRRGRCRSGQRAGPAVCRRAGGGGGRPHRRAPRRRVHDCVGHRCSWPHDAVTGHGLATLPVPSAMSSDTVTNLNPR